MRPIRIAVSILCAVGAAAWIACGSGQEEGGAGPAAGGAGATQAQAEAPATEAGTQAAAGGEPSAAAVQEAEQIFATRCYTCHGKEGGGDGPGSAGLTPPPRNFQDPTWQASVSDEHIAQIIQYGGAAVGKSPMMPGNPDLTSRPEVVAALVQHIRELSRD